ncbi:MAG: membrane protein insertase YidC [Bacteroidetes bacterium]|nr:membrane protein insertase YidC [Bacteroidota bacterium]
MDKNSAIGLTLIAVLLMGYFYFFSASPTPPQPLAKQDSTSQEKYDTVKRVVLKAAVDSSLTKQYGNLSAFVNGKEEFTNIENDVLKLTFSNNATLSEVNLKKFKTHGQAPLYLAKDGNNKFALTATYEGRLIDLYQLYYQTETIRQGDSTQIVFTAKVSETAYFKHIYTIPSKGYNIGYRIESKGIALTGKAINFYWSDFIALQEKDLNDSRNRTTVNYYTTEESFDGLSESSADSKTVNDLKWISIKQKFFLSAFFAREKFNTAELSISVDAKDSSYVKKADVNLTIPVNAIVDNSASFSYYFGPNDYRITKEVTEGFSRNMYLGWPPVIWVNKFLLMPVFDFLQTFIGNYGLIILLLVFFMKMLLMPLTYTSYKGMAKMRLLKPELDAIKEKNGDNMTQAQQDQMKLYQQAGVNPFAGCIPLLLQMPILFSMFYLFPNSIDLRQQPFLWAEDLSTWDSIATLPFSIPFGYGNHVGLFVLLMTASQIIYTWQNNQLTSVQGPMKSMSYIMPLIFLFVLNSFSAGLSFYYFVSNLITFAQQAVIKRFVDEDKIKSIMDENRKKAALGQSKKSKFMAKLEDAMKASEEARKKGKK